LIKDFIEEVDDNEASNETDFQYFHLRRTVNLPHELHEDYFTIAKKYGLDHGGNIYKTLSQYKNHHNLADFSWEVNWKFHPQKSAVSPNVDAVGGIDMNSNNLDLQTQRGRFDFQNVPNTLNLQNIRIDGFTPVILNVMPITNVPLLLGIVDTEDNPVVSDTQSLDPLDKKDRFEFDQPEKLSLLN